MRQTLFRPEAPICPFAQRKAGYTLTQRIEHGGFAIEIDPVREVGFFEGTMYRGQFWLAGSTYLGSDHLLPRPVQQGLARLGLEVA